MTQTVPKTKSVKSWKAVPKKTAGLDARSDVYLTRT